MNKNKKNMRGFTLGMAMIIMAILVTVSLGMSTLLLRDLKLVSVTERSSIAYNLADSMMSCVTSYENHIRYNNPVTGIDETGLFPTSTDFLYDINYKENYTTSDINTQIHYEKDSITCFDKKILDINDTSVVDIKNKVTLTSPASTMPIGYSGGALTMIRIQTANMKKNLNDACVVAEIYATTTQFSTDKLIITRGKIPCIGDKVVERVIVKKVQ